MLQISKGKQPRPVKLVIYGAEGIGKTTLAAQAPDPLFIDTEGGTSQQDVARVENIICWENLINVPREVAKDPTICKTLVLDTADWAEQMCIDFVCAKNGKKGIEDFGYGKGYTYLQEEFSKLLNALDSVVKAGVNVIVTAHGKMRKMELPEEQGAFDRWEMKLTKQVAPMLKEWADVLIFCNYKTIVIETENGSKKAQGGKRMMYANHSAVYDAKNRYGLPDEMPMDYSEIARIFNTTPAQDPHDKLRQMISDAGVTEDKFRAVVEAKGYYPEGTPISEYANDFLNNSVFPYFDRIVKAINN